MTSLWNEKTTFSDRNQQIDVLKQEFVDWFRFLLTSARYNALVRRMTFGIMMDSYFLCKSNHMSKDVKYISKISVVIHKSTIMKSINILLDGLNIYLLVD